MTEDEMIGWHHRLNGPEFEQVPGNGEGQGSLACCRPWGCKDSDTNEILNNSKKNRFRVYFAKVRGHLIFLILNDPYPSILRGKNQEKCCHIVLSTFFILSFFFFFKYVLLPTAKNFLNKAKTCLCQRIKNSQALG